MVRCTTLSNNFPDVGKMDFLCCGGGTVLFKKAPSVALDPEETLVLAQAEPVLETWRVGVRWSQSCFSWCFWSHRELTQQPVGSCIPGWWGAASPCVVASCPLLASCAVRPRLGGPKC